MLGSFRVLFAVSGCLSAALLYACSSPPFSRQGSRLPNPTAPMNPVERWGLADVRETIPGIVVDLRYATPNNVTGQQLYPDDMPCLLHRGTAEKLRRAQKILQAQGYGIKIWDGYRPPEAQRRLYDLAGSTGYVADPNLGWGRHCSGTAVDITLVDASGRECRMPTPFDEFSEKASFLYTGDDPEIRKHMRILQNAMFKAGFSVLTMEWWHFNDRDFDSRTPPPAVFASSLGIKMP